MNIKLEVVVEGKGLMFKPELTTLEACNHLALSEGQKENEEGNKEMMKISLKTIDLTLRTSQLYRMLVYALVTAIIEVPSIIVLYSLGYPNNPHATASTAFRIAYNIFFWLLVLSRSYPGADPGSLISNPLFQLFAGVVCMFIIVTLIGEAIVWLNGEISKLSREISNWRTGK